MNPYPPILAPAGIAAAFTVGSVVLAPYRVHYRDPSLTNLQSGHRDV
jgi:NADH:ubiquinone oxidoreductase subunit D